jgi:hypothetical protein
LARKCEFTLRILRTGVPQVMLQALADEMRDISTQTLDLLTLQFGPAALFNKETTPLDPDDVEELRRLTEGD